MRLLGSVRNEYTSKQLRYERWTWQFCNAIVTNSPHLTRQLIQNARVPEARLITIANGVDLHRFSPPTEQDASPPYKLFLMVGRISLQKSPALLVEALGILKERNQLPRDVRALIIGQRFQDEAQAALDEAIERYALWDIVTQEAQTTQPEAFYRKAHSLVLPSMYEGLPNAVLEALASGCPVILSESANAAEIIQNGTTGWIFRTGNATDLAEKLCKALEISADSLRQMRDRCIDRSRDYSMDRMVHAYQELYASLRAQPRTET